MLSSLENCSIELLCKPFLNKTTAFSTTSIVIQVVNRSKTKMKINILKKFTLNSNSYKKFAVNLMKLMNIIFLLKFLLQQNVFDTAHKQFFNIEKQMQDFRLKYFKLSVLRKRINFAEKSSPDSSFNYFLPSRHLPAQI